MELKNKKIAVLGLGVEGKSTVNFLLAKNIIPTILDKKSPKDLGSFYIELKSRGIKFITGKNYLKNLKKYDIIFRTPGVSYFTPEIQTALKSGVIITSQIKYFLEHTESFTIGVTGTKGKGTTSSCIYEMLKTDGKTVFLAGNIGKPLLDLPKLSKSDFVVIELSSFQLEDVDKSPNISVVLNITEDHLDYHSSLKNYIEAKLNIAKFAEKKDWLVLNDDYKTSKISAKNSKANKFYISTRKTFKKPNTCYLLKDKIILQTENEIVEICKISDIKLLGKHNYENIVAGISASHLAGVSNKSINKTIKTFKNLEHRLEFVRKTKGISYYNDSFSTNTQTTMAAIASFNQNIILIAGGFDKKLDYKELAAKITKNSKVKAVVLVGDAGNKIERELLLQKFKRKILLGAKNMDEMVRLANSVAKPDDVVLLSPSAASFDMFSSYKERGEQFKIIVNSL